MAVIGKKLPNELPFHTKDINFVLLLLRPIAA